jgi:type IV secretory pathway VirB3-like protein
MYSFIYLCIALMMFLVIYVLIGYELMVATLMFLSFMALLTIIGMIDEIKRK